MEGTRASSSGIVREVLTRYNNYEEWATLVRNYLIGKDLWDVVVERGSASTELEAQRTNKMNAKALHIIQLTCGSKIFHEIKHFETAASAWNHLARRYGSNIEAEPDIERGLIEDRFNFDGPLFKYAEEGNSRKLMKLLLDGRDKDKLFSISSSGRSILHVVTMAGNVDIVYMLIAFGKKELAEIQDDNGYTALALAAHYTGHVDIAQCMVKLGGEKLLSIRNREGEIPLLLAAARGHKQMTRYLYSVTPKTLLQDQEFNYGVLLLELCIKAEIFDVVSSILHSIPNLRLNAFGALNKLAQMPSAFYSGSHFGLAEQITYCMLRVENKCQNRFKFACTAMLPVDPRHKMNFVDRFCSSFMNFLLLPVQLLGIRKIYEQKCTHYQVLQILEYLASEVKRADVSQLYDAMIDAARHGIFEFINAMRKGNPDLLWAMDNRGRTIFSYAVLHRKHKVFRLIHTFNLQKNIMIDRSTDRFGNNLLHLAGHLGQLSDINHRPGAALQMQREIQWFKAVEEVVHPKYKEEKNEDNKKPHEVFTETHEELMKAGEKWAKDAAASFTIVGTLIITIMFAAAFTVPGGNTQDTGVPVFLNDNIFMTFVVADAISLFSSATSVLIFIEVQTSRFAEMDFLKNLPLKILFGLFFLFVSVVSMMVGFCAALAIVLQKYRDYKRLFVGGAILGSVPVIALIPSQLRLMYEIFRSTLSNPIHNIKTHV